MSVNPASPANNNSPYLIGIADEKTSVEVYIGSTCNGFLVAVDTAELFASPGIQVGVPDDSTTTFSVIGVSGGSRSLCSNSLTYVEDSTPPIAPSPIAMTPAGPANGNSPQVSGLAETGSTVNIYATNNCGGAIVATGNAAAFATGIAVAVLDNSTTSFTAKAVDVAGNISLCSASISYTEDSIVPTLTVNQAAAQSDPTNSLPITFDVVFSEAINASTFTSAAITQNGTATGITWTITNSGDDRNFTLRATAVTTNGTVVPLIAANAVKDPATNGNTASMSSDNSVTYDTVAPTVAITSPTAGSYINGGNVSSYTVSGTCSENGRTVTVKIDGSTMIGTPSCSSGAWSLTGLDMSSYSQGAHTITADHSDATGNNATQASVSVTKDTVAPTVAITSPTGGSYINSANVNSYSASGTCSENGRAVTVKIDGSTTLGTPSCSSGAWSLTGLDMSSYSQGARTITADHSDAAGNNATQASVSVTKDTVAPTVAITSPTGGSYINSANVSSYTVSGTCSENGKTVTVRIDSSTTLGTLGCASSAWSLTGLNMSSYSQGVHTITADHNDAAGNNATQASVSVTKDTVAPTLTLNQAAAQSDPTNLLPIVFDVVFSEAINASTFTPADITQNGTDIGITWTITNSGDDRNFTLRATAITGVGIVAPSIAANAVQDPAGNNNTVSTSTDNSVTYDNSTLGVTVNQLFVQADPTNALPITFDVVFTKAINASTFHITQNGTATGITWSLSTTDNINYTLQATAVTTNGTVVPFIESGVVQDPAGNFNTASTSSDSSVTYDTVAPTIVSINKKAGQADPTNAATALYTVTFSESITGLTTGKFSITTTSGTFSVAPTVASVSASSGTAIDVTLNTGTPSSATATLRLDLSTITGVTDTSGTTLSATRTGDQTVVIDKTAPAVASIVRANTDPTNAASVGFTVTFSESVTGVATGNFTLNTTGVTSPSITGVSGSGTTYTVTVNTGTGSGTIRLDLSSTTPTISDAATNALTATYSSGEIYTVDKTAPTVTITSPAALSYINIANKAAFTASGACSENTRTVSVAATGGATVNATPACTAGAWSATMNLTTLTDGTVTVTADHTDAAANNAVQATRNFNKDVVAPPIASAIALTTPASSPSTLTTPIFTVTLSAYTTGDSVSIFTSNSCAVPALQGTQSAASTSVAVTSSILSPDGAFTFYAQTTDIAGNIGTCSAVSATYTLDTTAPTVISVNSITADGNYGVGGSISIQVNFSEVVNVNGGPLLALNSGANASYSSGSGSSTLNFTYTVGAGQNSADLDYSDTTSLSAGISIKDVAGLNAIRTLPAPGATNSLGLNKALIIDTTAPTATSISINAGAPYTNTTAVTLTLAATETVSTPMQMYITNTAGCSAGGAWETYATSKAWTLGQTNATATVYVKYRDAAGNESTCVNNTIIHDNVAPTVTLSTTAPNPTNTSPIPVTATFSETVTGFALTDIVVGNGTAGTFVAVSGTVYTFNVTPTTQGSVTVAVSGDVAIDAAANGNTAATQLSITYDTVAPNVVTISIAAGANYTATTAITLTLSANGAASDMYITNTAGCGSGGAWETYATSKAWTLGQTNATATVYVKYRDAAGNESTCVNDTIIHDNIAPTVTLVFSSKTSGPWGVPTVVDVKVRFSEIVNVVGTPAITLNTTPTTRSATYVSGTGSTDLVFNYTIVADDSSARLDYTSTGALSAGTSIKDAAGNDANRLLPDLATSGLYSNNIGINTLPVLALVGTNPYNYGTQSVNVTHTFTLQNIGGGSTSSAITATLTGADTDGFNSCAFGDNSIGDCGTGTMTVDNCTGTTLAQNATCTITVTFLAGLQYAATYGDPTTGTSLAVLSATATSGGTSTNHMTGVVACPGTKVAYTTVTTGVTYPVPGGCQSVTVKAWGAGGARGYNGASYTNYGGGGGYAAGSFIVNPGDILTVAVGGGGKTQASGVAINGGGSGGGPAVGGGGGGGGYSAVKQGGLVWVLAGGGGGTATVNVGGAGGGSSGLDGIDGGAGTRGRGGTAVSGGVGGPMYCVGGMAGTDGSQFLGGTGGVYSNTAGAGGGGGGWYGGGGGGTQCGSGTGVDGGGGGGSSYLDLTIITNTANTAGSVGTYTPGNSGDVDRTGNIGNGGSTLTGPAGMPGKVVITPSASSVAMGCGGC